MDKLKIINNKLNELSNSKFRSQFHLRKYMLSFLEKKGYDTIIQHAYDIINRNLKPAHLKNDGRQTPTKNHPVFIAQHACGCCCRKCLKRWHNIPLNRELTSNEVNYIVSLLIVWIIRDYKNQKNDSRGD